MEQKRAGGSGATPCCAVRTHLAPPPAAAVLPQGVGIDGTLQQQKQTVKQVMKDMAKSTLSKSK